MSNSSRIEAATRKHVGATLTSEQIVELVRVSNPEWKGGVYPSDAAGKRQDDGTLTHRGAVMYGDLVLELMAKNSFKVLPTDQIVRRPQSKKRAEAVAAPAPAATPVTPAAKPEPEKKAEKTGKKSAKSASQPPVAPKSKAISARV
jgi:hypothetical protein